MITKSKQEMYKERYLKYKDVIIERQGWDTRMLAGDSRKRIVRDIHETAKALAEYDLEGLG